MKKEDGQAISAQYLNDIEHDRRNPPSEFLIAQMAELLRLSRMFSASRRERYREDLQKWRERSREKVEQAFKAFRKAVKDSK